MNKLLLKDKRAEIPKVGLIIMLAVAAIFSLTMIQQIFSDQNTLTDLQPIGDETIDLSSTGCLNATGNVNESSSNCNITLAQWTTYDGDWRTSESQCYPSSVVVTNTSGTALILNTDYTVVASSGLVNMLQTSDTDNYTMGNSVLIDYNYCEEGYNKDSGSRGIAAIIGLFAGLALVAYLISYGLKEWM